MGSGASKEMQCFVENMGKLYEQGLFTDCTIKTEDGKEFKAHKGILACQSPVFRAMFEDEKVETNEGIIKIENIKSPVFEQMLIFMYTTTVPDPELEMVMELFEAAVEYQLESLKNLCESGLSVSIENKNVCELLILADRHSAEELKTKAIEYIQEHAKKVMKTKGWKMLVEGNYGKLMEQILKAFVDKMDESDSEDESEAKSDEEKNKADDEE